MGTMQIAKSIRALWPILAASALLSVTSLNSGCFVVAAGAAGAGTVAFVEGKLTVTLANSYDSVVRATDRSIAQMQYFKLTDQRDALKSTFTLRTPDDQKVTIEIERKEDNLTGMEIRVGTFGDKQESIAILDHIKTNL
jgi:hypothetical protein